VLGMTEIKFLDADSQGVVEHGYIRLGIGGIRINITIQQHSNGVTEYLLDDIEYKELLELNGVRFNGEEIIGSDEFISELYNFYEHITREER
jgi:hypothetical protein